MKGGTSESSNLYCSSKANQSFVSLSHCKGVFSSIVFMFINVMRAVPSDFVGFIIFVVKIRLVRNNLY